MQTVFVIAFDLKPELRALSFDAPPAVKWSFDSDKAKPMNPPRTPLPSFWGQGAGDGGRIRREPPSLVLGQGG